MISVAELDERIERCLTILADNPHSQVFAALAEAYRRRGEFGRAFSVCKSGLKHHPDYALAHIVMAKLYLHHRMTEEALASLQRAVEIDGPTRATDLLEAELHLMTGDATAAQVVINRLRRGQPNNPVVEELAQQLRNLRSNATPVRAESATADENEQDSSASPPVRTTAKLVIDWTEWAAATGQMRGVTGAVVFDATGQTLASHAQGEATHAKMEIVSTLFGDVEAHLRTAGWGTLRELRIEMKDREVWAGRVNDFIMGLTGNLQGSFGEVRRRALETAAHAGSTHPGDTAGDSSNSPDLTGDGHRDMPRTAPGDDGSRDRQGNTYGV
jgi:predicted regulator of Ras-like GTPase activity (Roadblock/LC7/MglB family)